MWYVSAIFAVAMGFLVDTLVEAAAETSVEHMLDMDAGVDRHDIPLAAGSITDLRPEAAIR